MRYTVTYPNRGVLPPLEGDFKIVEFPKVGKMPTIDSGASLNTLDPRAVIVDGDGKTVYTPWDIPLDEHTKDMRRWLRSNPQWGRRT
jgi:hypothetical protein